MCTINSTVLTLQPDLPEAPSQQRVRPCPAPPPSTHFAPLRACSPACPASWACADETLACTRGIGAAVTRDAPQFSVFVGGLPYDITVGTLPAGRAHATPRHATPRHAALSPRPCADALKALFERYGRVIDCAIKGGPPPFAFVAFADRKALDQCLANPPVEARRLCARTAALRRLTAADHRCAADIWWFARRTAVRSHSRDCRGRLGPGLTSLA
jgi:hypothetical protein